MVATLNVNHPIDAFSKVRWRRVVKTTARQNTKVELYCLWDQQPVMVMEEQADVFRMPC